MWLEESISSSGTSEDWAHISRTESSDWRTIIVNMSSQTENQIINDNN